MKTSASLTELPWDNEPINLPLEWVNDPLSAVKDFYFSNMLPDFKKLLQQWLLAGIEDEHKWEYPKLLQLIHGFDDMIQLVEALFLINKKGITAAQVKSDIRKNGNDPIYTRWSAMVLDRLTWNDLDESEFYTTLLSGEEEANPYLVVKAAFDSYSLPELRANLKFWFHTAITNPWEYTAMDNVEMVKLYNLMNRLVEAGFVINELHLLQKNK